jgi:flavin-binding protein dodecin
MSIAKVIEVIAESDKGWADAARNAVAEASKSVKNIKHVYVENMHATVENDQITTFRLNAKVTFLVK